jgi:transcriptional regulator with XRE-family HTH domain
MTKHPPITRLRDLREARLISQVELAVASGVGLTTLQKLERATRLEEIALTGVGHFIYLGEALGVSASEVFPELGRRKKHL